MGSTAIGFRTWLRIWQFAFLRLNRAGCRDRSCGFEYRFGFLVAFLGLKESMLALKG